MYIIYMLTSSTILPVAFRSKMMKIVSQLAALIPRTAASEALLVTEQLVQKKMENSKGISS